LVFSTGPRAETADGEPWLRRVTVTALLLLAVQIALGGLTSANFGATACTTLPDCQGRWLPGPGLAAALDLSREHQVNEFGVVIGGVERGAIHRAHRLGAILTLSMVLAAGIIALRAGRRFRWVALGLLLLVVAEFSVGVAAILSSLPIGLAVAHNWLAGLLLLALLKSLALQTTSEGTE
jgi:heme a synthase